MNYFPVNNFPKSTALLNVALDGGDIQLENMEKVWLRDTYI